MRPCTSPCSTCLDPCGGLANQNANVTGMWAQMSFMSLMTAVLTGMPVRARSAWAWRSGSPGISTCPHHGQRPCAQQHLLAGLGLAVAERVDPVVNLPAELGGVAEAVDAQPAKEVANALSNLHCSKSAAGHSDDPQTRLSLALTPSRSVNGGANGPQLAPDSTQHRMSTMADRQYLVRVSCATHARCRTPCAGRGRGSCQWSAARRRLSCAGRARHGNGVWGDVPGGRWSGARPGQHTSPAASAGPCAAPPQPCLQPGARSLTARSTNHTPPPTWPCQ